MRKHSRVTRLVSHSRPKAVSAAGSGRHYVTRRPEVDTMPLEYMWVPSPKQFQKDTSITFAIRSHDRILKHIDWLLERYEARSQNVTQYEHSKRLVILCDLYFTCKFWIKSFSERRPAMKAERHAG